MFTTSCKLNTCFVTLPTEKFCRITKVFSRFIRQSSRVVTEFKLLGVIIDVWLGVR